MLNLKCCCCLNGIQASYDSVLLLTSILMFGLPAVYSYTQQKFFEFYFFKVFPFITPVVYPVGMIAQTGLKLSPFASNNLAY